MSEIQPTHSSWFQRFDLYEILFRRLPALYRRQDALLHGTVLLTLVLAIIIQIFNLNTHRYTSLNYPVMMLTAAPGLLIVWVTGVLLRPRHPRTGLFLASFAQSFLFIMVMAFALSAAITTPFPTIDHLLLHWDQVIHFNTISLLNWTYHFPVLVYLLKFGYDFWFPLLFLTPLGLALMKQRESIDHYFMAMFLSFLIGATLYYFFPTIAPAGVLNSVHFMQSQHELVERFQEVHRSVPITVYGGGMIAFPSFHVINTLIVLYTWRRWPWVFLPLLLIVSLSIAATMLLGYHYFIDVIAGAVLAGGSLYLANILLNKKAKALRCEKYSRRIN